MGQYNPDAPTILGNEFAAIRNWDLTLQSQLDSVESGYSFTVSATRTLQDGRIYAQTSGSRTALGRVPFCINVYPQGAEAKSGPVQSVVIPCNQGWGVGDSNLTIRANNATITPASPSTTFAPAVQGFANAAATENGVLFAESNAQSNIVYTYFDVADYAQQLNGKRILAVNLLYKLQGDDNQAAADGTGINWGFVAGASSVATSAVGFLPSSNLGNVTILRAGLGSISDKTQTFLPWTISNLLNMQGGASTTVRNGIYFSRQQNFGTIPAISSIYQLTYVALEVLYCEEQRIAVGVGEPQDPVFGNGVGEAPFGAWVVPMRDLSGNLNPQLAPGSYTVTVSSPEFLNFSAQVYPAFNALLMNYPVSSHPGITIVKPYPLYNNVGSVFTSQTSTVLPQLTLHTSSGPIPETQVYGRLAAVPIYNTVSATQTIDTSNIATSTYSQVRFYARYFGTPDAALTFSCNAVSAVLTKAAFDALPTIVDGWKEVTLPWGPSALTGGSTFGAIWGSNGTFIANRWEILGVRAPSVTGIAGSNITPTAQVLNAATYLQPNGATDLLTWQSPSVTGTAGDPTSDAVILFSQDPGLVNAAIAAAGADGTFESGVTGWTTTGMSSFTQDTAHVHGGTKAGKMVANGLVSPALLRTQAKAQGIVAGQTYTLSAWAYSVTGWSSFGAAVDWLDVNGNFISTSETTPVALGAGAYQQFVTTAVAPAGATQATYGIDIHSVTGQTPTIWVDDITFNLIGQPLATVKTQTLSNVGQLCGVVSQYIPTGLTYVNLTWNNPGATGFGYYELQRFDAIDNAWNDIMLTTSQGQTTFNDYEARIGQTSQYRMRIINALGFIGAWSTPVTVTLTAPGITGTNVANGALVFTANGAQSGSRNLAYTMALGSDAPTEDLTFLEAPREQMNWLYGKDFMSVFMPTERGGEQFARTLLVQNASIAGPQIEAGFRSMRDLGWAQLPYVCVRNEIGDRWYANVQVPGGTFQRNRQLQMVNILITEISTIPAVIDPVTSP